MKQFISLLLPFILILTLPITISKADFLDYVRTVGSYLNLGNADDKSKGLSDEFSQRIPYEVSEVDQKFIQEAAKLTGVALSELDSCQQRVVLKLRTDCHSMNDEQLAKMAVHLLNCQSYVEGRLMYPCTDDMSIKACTQNMDSDTWTSYHLMSNRARAVCYSIRQIQFSGLAKHTVNQLMETAQTQLKTLNKIATSQEDLQDVAQSTLSTLSQGHEVLAKQQKDIQQAQFYGQLALEDNIRKLSLEKQLILETHSQLIDLAKNIQKKLESSGKQIESQVDESRVNHQELIDDLVGIQNKAHIIFQRIEESSDLLIKQNEDFKRQSESTLRNLAEVNKTVHNLVTLVGGTRQALEERLNWLSSALGGTDLAVERLYMIIWHAAFIMISMLTCAFLSAKMSTRLVVATLPPLNLAVALSTTDIDHMGPFGLTVSILSFVIAQFVLLSAWTHKESFKLPLAWRKEAPEENNISSTSSQNVETPKEVTIESEYGFRYSKLFQESILEEEDATFSSPTPPASRNGFYPLKSRSNTPLRINTSIKEPCKAKTRVGTPCKLTSLPGRDFCYRHQSGDSVMG